MNKRSNSDEKVLAKQVAVKSLTEVNVNDYVAIFFVGGHGQVIDLVIDPDCARLVDGRQVCCSCLPRSCMSSYPSFTHVSATHWPVWFSALISARMNGKSIFSGKKVTGFSNTEEEAARDVEVLRYPMFYTQSDLLH